jgi:crotonobetaine/carnitine-CoA ligase
MNPSQKSFEHAVGPAGSSTVDSLVERGAMLCPDRILVEFRSNDSMVESLTWQEMHSRVLAFAATLHRMGVGPGVKVNIHLENRPEFLVAWFACARLGAVMVPTNVASSVEELTFQLQHSETEICLTDQRFEAPVRQAAGRAGRVRHVLLAANMPGTLKDEVAVPDRRSRPEDPLAILYTSGTTARPKGVVVSHAAYGYAGLVVSRAIGLTDKDRFLTVLPLFHGNAQYYSVMSVLVSRATLLLMERFSASKYFMQAEAHGATVGSLFAAPARMILAHPQSQDPTTNRMRCMVFAQNLSEGQLAAWNERFGVPITQLYGMTETVGPPTFNPVGEDARPMSIGRVSLGYLCRVVNDDGVDVRPGEPGELIVWGIPGLSIMSGYLKDPDATAAVLRDGWLCTGDVVYTDEEGFFYFVDRMKDMMKISGENVAASEVESVLKQHPRVFDAAVIGVPDDVRDERIVAFVVPDHRGLDVQEVTEWCSERLARFRVPSEVLLLRELPRTAVGKIQKHVLKAEYALGNRGETK